MFTVFSRELTKTFKTWGFLITTFGMPFFTGFYFLFLAGVSWFATTQFSDSAEKLFVTEDVVGILDESLLLSAEKAPLYGLKSGKRYLHKVQRPIVSPRKRLEKFGKSKTEIKSEEVERPRDRIIPFVVFQDLEVAKSSLKEGEVVAVAQVSKDYIETGLVHLISLESSDSGVLGYYSHRSALDKILRDAVLNRAGVSSELLLRINDRSTFSENNLVESGEIVERKNEQSSKINRLLGDFSKKGLPYVFAVLVIFVVIGNSNALVRSMAAERDSKLIEVLLTAVNARQLITGKVLGILCASLVQLGVWMLMGLALPLLFAQYSDMSVNFELSWSQIAFLCLFAITGMLFYGFFYATIGAFKKDPSEVSGMKKIAISFQFVVFYALVIYLPNASDLSWSLISTIPFLTPLLMPFQIISESFSASTAVLHLILMALFTVLMMRLSARIFMVRLMYSGQEIGVLQLLAKAAAFKD